MHQQMEKTRPVKQVEIVVAGIEEVFGKGDQKALCFVVYFKLMQLTGDDAIQGIVTHFIPLQIDIQAAVAVPDPDDLDVLVPMGHLVLLGSVLT
jgi:hypothetical protein